MIAGAWDSFRELNKTNAIVSVFVADKKAFGFLVIELLDDQDQHQVYCIGYTVQSEITHLSTTSPRQLPFLKGTISSWYSTKDKAISLLSPHMNGPIKELIDMQEQCSHYSYDQSKKVLKDHFAIEANFDDPTKASSTGFFGQYTLGCNPENDGFKPNSCSIL